MTAPTFVAEYETAWNTTTTPKTSSVTTAVGDVLVVIGMAEGRLATLATPTGGTGLTWTLRQEVTATPASDWCTAKVWTATATTAETFSLSVARSGTAQQWGFIALRFSGSDGIGASAKTNVSSGAPSLGITTTGADSALAVGSSDWNAVDGASRTWRTVNGAAATEQAYFRDSAAYTLYAGYHANAGTAGAKTVGLSAPSGQKYSIVAVEVLGTSGGSPQTVTPTGIATGAAVGTPVVQTAITVSPSGIASGQGVGTPTISNGLIVTPTGIGTGAALGTPTVQTTVTVSPSGIGTASAVGTPTAQATITVSLTGIATEAATGTPQVTATVTVAPSGIPTGAVVGTPSVFQGDTLSPAGIPSAAQVGTPTIVSIAPPATPTYIFVTPSRPMVTSETNPLYRRVPYPMGTTILKMDGVFRQIGGQDIPEWIDAAEKVYLGGHEYVLTEEEYQELSAAGYGEYIRAVGYGAGVYGDGYYGVEG